MKIIFLSYFIFLVLIWNTNLLCTSFQDYEYCIETVEIEWDKEKILNVLADTDIDLKEEAVLAIPKFKNDKDFIEPLLNIIRNEKDENFSDDDLTYNAINVINLYIKDEYVAKELKSIIGKKFSRLYTPVAIMLIKNNHVDVIDSLINYALKDTFIGDIEEIEMSGVLKKNQNILLKRWPELIKAFNDKNPEISTFADVFIMSLEVDSIYTRIFDISCELYYKKYNLPFCYYNINKRWYRSKEAIERLNKNKQDLKNSDIQVRYKALCNLALIKNEKAIKCIFNALNDTSPKIRSLAIYLLKKNNYFKHSNYLKNFLDDESSDVRIAAFEYFKEIYKPDNIDFYIGILKNKDQYLRLLNFIFLMEKNNNWYKEKDLKPYYYFIAELLFSEKQKYHLYKEDYDEIIKVLNYIDPDITSTLLQLKEARDSQEFENRIIFK